MSVCESLKDQMGPNLYSLTAVDLAQGSSLLYKFLWPPRSNLTPTRSSSYGLHVVQYSADGSKVGFNIETESYGLHTPTGDDRKVNPQASRQIFLSGTFISTNRAVKGTISSCAISAEIDATADRSFVRGYWSFLVPRCYRSARPLR